MKSVYIIQFFFIIEKKERLQRLTLLDPTLCKRLNLMDTSIYIYTLDIGAVKRY